MRETREDRKHRLSLKGSNAVRVRWDRHHETCPAPVYDQHHAYGEYEIKIRSIRSGNEHTLYLHEGARRDNFYADLDGKPFLSKAVSICRVSELVRKNIVKTRSGRIV